MTIEERLDHLEKANRRWRTFAVSLSLVLAMGLFMAQGPGQIIPDVIRAKKIEVIGKNGSPVVSLSSWDRGGRIHAMTNSGKMLFESTAGEISVYNSNGQKLVKLSATKEGEGLLATYNHKGEGVVAIGATKEGEGALATYNGDGQKLVTITAADNGGAISVWNTTGEAICTARVDQDGNGEVGAWNRDGKGRTLTPGTQ